MGRIVEETLVTLDGVIEDPAQWVGEYFDDEFLKATFERLCTRDAMLMGRRTYQILAKDWAGQTGEYAGVINSMPKYVFSSTLEKADWKNSTIVRSDAIGRAQALKKQSDRDLVIWGHGLLAESLLAHGLLDELRISVFPLVAGHGKLLFREGATATLRLLSASSLPTGVAVLQYQPA